MASPVIVPTASSLKHICDGSFPEIFISNINNIYAHEDSDINKVLESKAPCILKVLWNKTISLLQDRHEPCKHRSPLKCKQRKTDIISDISLICRFLSTPDKEKP